MSNHNSGIKVKSALISFPMLKLSHYVDRKPGKAGKIPREKLGSDYELNIQKLKIHHNELKKKIKKLTSLILP